MPDIISCEAAGFGNWEGLLVDLSDQNWASRTDAAYQDSTYGTLGFPFTTEAIGFAYNASILEKCGIDPASITGPDSMKAAIEAIDAKKDSLAENSRQTAANIQGISGEVTDAVNHQAENAQKALDYTNGTVLGDYDQFVTTGEKYEHTADIMDEMLNAFDSKAENLNSIMTDMVDSVQMITDSIKESSSAIQLRNSSLCDNLWRGSLPCLSSRLLFWGGL